VRKVSFFWMTVILWIFSLWMDNQHLVLWFGPCSTQRQAQELILGPKLATWVRLLSFNTFTAIINLSWFNNSCLKMTASTLVDLIFKSRSFSLNQLTYHYMRETCTAASVYLADVAYIAI
jgi:hypothetical protein